MRPRDVLDPLAYHTILLALERRAARLIEMRDDPAIANFPLQRREIEGWLRDVEYTRAQVTAR